MTRKELLDLPVADYRDEIPLLDEFYVIPTKRKHDSGYRIMEIVGVAYKKDKGGRYIGNEFEAILDRGCDVIDFDFWQRVKGGSISMDIHPENGCPRFFSRGRKFEVIYRHSTFNVELRED